MEPSSPGRRSPSRAVRVAVLLALVAVCIACDHATKQLALAHLPPGRRFSYLGDVLRLELAHNPGAFLSMGAALPSSARSVVFTYGVAVVVLGALFLAFRRRSSTRTAVAAALVAAGGLGNLWDRLATGGWVIDFLNVGIGPVRTGIFNVADVAIVAGVAVLALPVRTAPRSDPDEGAA